MSISEVRMLDITAPEHLAIRWDADRRVLYIDVEGITVLRACRVQNFYHDLKRVKSGEIE